MSRLSKTIITVAILILIVGGGIFFGIYNSKKVLVPEDSIGNTAGNLYNKGLYCEDGGRVFFANGYDDYKLYSMNPDQSDIKKVSNLSVEYINAGGDYLFFHGRASKSGDGFGSIVARPSLTRLRKDGSKFESLSINPVRTMILIGNNIYFQEANEKTGIALKKYDIKTDKESILLSKNVVPACYYNGSFFYNGQDKDHYLYAYNVAGEVESVIWQGDIWNPIYDGNYVYYMDIQNNYRLCRYSIPQNTIEIITKERLDFFNIYGDYIYYQVSSPKKPCLKRVHKDGSGQELVMEGTFTDINITSSFVYFHEFGNDYPVYCTPTSGAVNVREFTAARDAFYNTAVK